MNPPEKSIGTRFLPGLLILLLILSGFFYGVIHGDFYRAVDRFLIVRENPVKSDLIIVLSGASVEERVRCGARLYREGYAPKLLLSGNMTLMKETGYDLMKIYAEKLGVDSEAIIREPFSQTTWGNARRSLLVVEENGFHSVLVVTSPHHTRRAGVIFRKIFPQAIRVTVTADPPEALVEPWWSNYGRVREVVHEYLCFLWGSMMGFYEGAKD